MASLVSILLGDYNLCERFAIAVAPMYVNYSWKLRNIISVVCMKHIL